LEKAAGTGGKEKKIHKIVELTRGKKGCTCRVFLASKGRKKNISKKRER